MARTIAEIKDSMTADFMRNPDVAHAYGFEPGASFGSLFSPISIESLLFYVVACTVWTLECLFDCYRSEVESRIETIIPHRPKWYRDKVLGFMKDMVLAGDSDVYDTSGMTEAQTEAAMVVKFAAATENQDASILTIKVAGGSEGNRSPLDQETERQLMAYLAEIKDAGVRISLINKEADVFNCEIDVWFDALLQKESVEVACYEAVRSYIEDLPFNGEYTNMSLIDRLQAVEGVRIAEMRGAETMVSGESTPTRIDGRYTPASGYFKVGTVKLNLKIY